MTTSRRFVAIPFVFVSLLLAAAGAGAEEITIFACAQKNSGDLRIVDSLDDCRKSEVPVWWNQVGPAGDPGPPGPAGESTNQEIRELADLLGQPALAEGLPLNMTNPVECTASLMFEGPGGAMAAVVGLIGTDTVSETFSYHLVTEFIASASSAWLGDVGSVTFHRDEGDTIFGGMITEVGTTGDAAGTGYTVVTLEPHLSALAPNAENRIYQEKNAPDVIGEVLDEAGLEWETLIAGTYSVHDCTVQYDESDLAFVRRIAETAGIFFYFNEEGVIAVGDSTPGFGGPGVSLTYPGTVVPLPPGEETITALIRDGWLTSDQATVRGYRLADPAVPFESTVGTGDGSREVFAYDPSLIDGTMVDDRAAVNLERFQVPSDLASGVSTSADVRAGYGLAVTDTSGNGMSGDYNVTQVTHVFVRSDDGCVAYGNVFGAVPASTDYRPPKRTPVPKVQGMHTAIVTGGTDGTINADEFGRVFVQFLWDRHGEFDENSFCRVRVNQPAGTLGEVDPFIPPAGQEVLVGFIQGDPSQPVVLGSLFNGQDQPPGP